MKISELEKNILYFWQKDNTFQKSLKPSDKTFIFYDGPPFANGMPHYGHILTGYIKDLYGRYATMKGKFVDRRFGWDCHGLPAEMAAEKELNIFGTYNIKQFGIDKFNEHCKTSVMKYANAWETYVTRQARWVDFHNDYKTMDISFMESVLWAFKELYKKGLVYEAKKVMPFSWKCETPLSNFETRMDDCYRDRTDKTVTALFKLKNQNTYICAWTTTPWTLPSNLALAVNKNLTYEVYSNGSSNYIIGDFAKKTYKKELENLSFVKTILGADLINLDYEPLFNYFASSKNAFKILHGDFVTNENGTGIVHIAPAFGEDDQILCETHNIDMVCPVDNSGNFTAEVDDLHGINIFDANDIIIRKLKNQEQCFKVDQYIHSYPHCWRTGTPLIYKAVSSWWIRVTEIKDRMVELNQQINWIPETIKNGLFGKWLENARDWAISRKRFWGCPIPIWISTDNRYPRIDVYGSIQELERDFSVKVTSLHRPFIDSLTRKNPNDPTGQSDMKRIEDVFDCWFESGSMPYGQAHYPFENQEHFIKNFPADFITEYTAQTRGWFYTLMVLSTALFDKPPFLNCICHGVILDDKGQKLSKSKQNYSDPLEIFDKYGSDSLRFLTLSSSIVRGGEFNIDKEGKIVETAQRLFISPILNAINFYALYAKIDNVKFQEIHHSPYEIDNYILSKMAQTTQNIDNALAAYDSVTACNEIKEFFEILNNWYIRRNRYRFWQSNMSDEKEYAFMTLATCFKYMSIAIAPIIPIIAEVLYQSIFNLNILENGQCVVDSVHLQQIEHKISINSALIAEMDNIIEICHIGLSIRSDKKVRIRQPISQIVIAQNKPLKYIDLIQEELNVKTVIVETDFSNYADVVIKLNYSAIGSEFNERSKEIFSYFKQHKVAPAQQIILGDITLLQHKHFSVEAKPKLENSGITKDNQTVIIMNFTLTEALIREGDARDLIRVLQQTRKDLNFLVTDRINLILSAEQDFINENLDMIKSACLITNIKIDSNCTQHAFNNFYFNIYVN